MKDDLISRREAIDALAEWNDAAITNRLNNLPSVQPFSIDTKVSGNLISRQAALDALGKDPMGGLNYESILSRLPSVQPEKRTETHAETHACDLISRQAAIDALDRIGSLDTEADKKYARSIFEALPYAQSEPLTDKEQRIFLAAMGREKKVCKKVDEECRDCREPYEDSLVHICHEIIRKVKDVLWA